MSRIPERFLCEPTETPRAYRVKCVRRDHFYRYIEIAQLGREIRVPVRNDSGNLVYDRSVFAYSEIRFAIYSLTWRTDPATQKQYAVVLAREL